VLRFRYRTLFTAVDLTALRTGHVRSIRAHFPHMLRWAGMEAIKHDPDHHENGRARGFTIKAGAEEEFELFPIGDGLRCLLEPDWSVDAPSDSTIRVGLGVEVSSTRPRLVAEMIGAVVDIQLLLSTAHDTWAACRSARGRDGL